MCESIYRNKARGITVERVPLLYVLSLRNKVLQNGVPNVSAAYGSDSDPASWHLAIFAPPDGGRDRPTLACASFVPESYQLRLGYQLVGMCTDESYRGMGLGSVMLEAFEANLPEKTGIKLYWGAVPASATRFFEKRGWKTDGPASETEANSHEPHFRMTKLIQAPVLA